MKQKKKTTKRTPEQTSYIMGRVHGKDTKIEIMLRRELWRRGLRYRKNVSKIIGKPDIVFRKYKIAVFCDSEFWHGHDWEKRKKTFKTNKKYWRKKIERNMERDIEVNKALAEEGWTVLRFLGNHIMLDVGECADIIEEKIAEIGLDLRGGGSA